MHAADWLPTLATAAGINLENSLANIDGVSQWDAMKGSAAKLAVSPPRDTLVIGNSTNDCSWNSDDSDLPSISEDGSPRTAMSSVGCGFSIVNDTGSSLWKLIRGYVLQSYPFILQGVVFSPISRGRNCIWGAAR